MEILSLDPLYFIALLAIGIPTGILSGLFGIGGGAIIVPFMILLGNDIKIAVGISIMQMIFSSIYGSYLNYKQHNLDFKDGIYAGFGGLIGAAFSGVVVDTIPSRILEGVFTLFIAYSLVKFFRANAEGGESRLGNGIGTRLFLVGGSCIVGVFAISLGVGGGMMLAPLLAYYLGYSSKKIVPISLFFIIFSSISGFTSLALHGYADYKQGFLVGISSIIGVRIGIWLLGKINAKKHKYALLILYCLILIFMLKKIFLG